MNRMQDDHTPPFPGAHATPEVPDAPDADRPVHQRAWGLIPWLVNRSATAAERALVAEHVAGCEDCRDELAFQRQLQAQMGDGRVTAAETEAALQRMASLIDSEAPTAPQPLDTAPPASHPPRWTRMLVAAVVVQAVGLAALLGMISERPRPADYQTLSHTEPANPAAVLRLVAAPSVTLGDLQALLARSGAVIVDSSADGAAFGLALRPGTARDAALAALRQAPGVLLAEPIVVPIAVPATAASLARTRP